MEIENEITIENELSKFTQITIKRELKQQLDIKKGNKSYNDIIYELLNIEHKQDTIIKLTEEIDYVKKELSSIKEQFNKRISAIEQLATVNQDVYKS